MMQIGNHMYARSFCKCCNCYLCKERHVVYKEFFNLRKLHLTFKNNFIQLEQYFEYYFFLYFSFHYFQSFNFNFSKRLIPWSKDSNSCANFNKMILITRLGPNCQNLKPWI